MWMKYLIFAVIAVVIYKFLGGKLPSIGKSKEEKKLDEDMPPYRILGACNPVLAHQAVTAVPDIGLLLPCNVLVRQDSEGAVHVSFMDPGSVLGLVDHPDVVPLAAEVKATLENVLNAL